MAASNSTPELSPPVSVDQIDVNMEPSSEQILVQLIELLELDAAADDSRNIALNLIDKGRQGLQDYRNEISEDTYETLMASDHRELLTLLTTAIRRRWTAEGPVWLKTFLDMQQATESDTHQRVLRLVSEHGCAWMRGCVPLALVIAFQYEIFESNDTQTDGKFDQVWRQVIENGRKGCPNVPASERDDPLLLGLKEFYRDQVVQRLKCINMSDAKRASVTELALNLVALNGWDGLKDEQLKRKLPSKAFEELNGGGGTQPDPIRSIRNPNLPSPPSVPKESPLRPSLSNTIKVPFQFANEQILVKTCVNEQCLLTMSDLTQAGELIYTTDTLTSISNRLLKDFSTNHKQFSTLLKNCFIPMMYLLKRELNLLDFIKLIKQGLRADRKNPRPSQRMLVDILLKNSENFLAQTLVKLLSKRNPVPLFEVHEQSQEFIPYIVHVWEYDKPTILSFGIGPCAGKSSLLNSLFLSNFEQTIPSSYFQQTIDVDFGYNFIPPRPINVADVHGPMSLNVLKKVSSLFDSYIIHVNAAFLFTNLPLVEQFLAQLPNNAYRYLLVRDSNLDEDETALDQLPISGRLLVPQISDKTTDDSQFYLKELLTVVYETTHFTKRRLSKNNLAFEFERLLSPEHLNILNQEKELIRYITPTLINGHKNHFPLYDIFVEMCKKRDELSRIDFYGSQDNEAMFNTQAALYELEVKLKRIAGNQKDCGEAFRVFFELLQKPSKFSTLSILASTLKQEVDEKLKASQRATDLPYEQRLSMEAHWRNAIVCYEHLPSDQQKQELVQHYQDMIATGQPFEIIDGDNFYYQSSFLEKVMVNMQGVRFFVISIIGPQNSGKSTLLNYMFGTLFDVRDGRCTRGKSSI